MKKAFAFCLIFYFLSSGLTTFCHTVVHNNPATTLCNSNNQFKQGLELKKKGKLNQSLTFFYSALSDIQNKKDKTSEITCLYWIGITEMMLNKYPTSLSYFIKADSIQTKFVPKHGYFLDVKFMEGRLYYKMAKLSKAYSILENCMQLSKNIATQDSTIANILQRKGSIEFMQGNYYKAIETYTLAKKTGTKAFGANSTYVVDQLNALGVMHQYIGQNDEALSFYMQSQALINSAHLNYPYGLAASYCNIAILFANKNDFENDLHFLNKALELFKADFEDGKSSITSVYINMAVAYQNLKQYEKQVTNLKLALLYAEKYTPPAIPKIYWMYATYYTNINDFKQAENYYKISLKKNEEFYGEGPELAYIYGNYGYFAGKYLHDNDKAIKLSQKSIPLHLKFFGIHNPSTGFCYNTIGDAYFAKKDYKNALIFYHKALISNSETFADENVMHPPGINQSLNDISFADILKSKAMTIGKMAMLQKDQTQKLNLLTTEFENNKLAIDVIDKIRAGYINEESRLFLAENELHTFQISITEALNLFRLTNNIDYIKNAFAFADKEHAASLQMITKENILPKTFKFTDSLAQNQQRLKKELSVFHELIIKEKSSKHTDSIKLKLWNQKVTDLTLSIENSEVQLRKKNPVYYQLKLQEKPALQIQNIQKNLLNDEIMLEYFYTDSLLYVFYLSNKELKYKEITVDQQFEKNIEKVSNFIRQPSIDKSDASNVVEFKIASWNLYNCLIKPFEKDIKDKKLVIIPYDKLNYIPFEILLTEPCNSNSLSFKQLPYLLKNNTIRYSYAGALLNTESNNKDIKGKMAAFIPFYGDKNLAVSTNKRNESFSSLSQNEIEGKSIMQYFPVKLFKSQKASEEIFKEESGNFSSLHLAMHAVINDENPMFSYLAFTPNASTKDDDRLYTYEIYNLKLNVQMLVLGACNTGFGKLRKGEGMMSLTRSFAFAGVPSIVTTLWTINDNTSAIIMNDFYKELNFKQNKGESLSNSKLKYLQNADMLHSHPYYWASYILIGNNSPIIMQSKNLLNIWIGVILITCLMFIWIVRRYKLRKLLNL